MIGSVSVVEAMRACCYKHRRASQLRASSVITAMCHERADAHDLAADLVAAAVEWRRSVIACVRDDRVAEVARHAATVALLDAICAIDAYDRHADAKGGAA